MRIRATTAAKAAKTILAKLDKGLVRGGTYYRGVTNIYKGEGTTPDAKMGQRCAIGWLMTAKQAARLESLNVDGSQADKGAPGGYPLVSEMMRPNAPVHLPVPPQEQHWFKMAQAFADGHDYASLRQHCELALAPA